MGMSDNNGSKPRDLEDEIQRAMSEAEAAVDAIRDDDRGDPSEIEPQAASADDPPDAAEEIVRLEQQNAELRDKWLRAVADHENYRKRVRREVDDAVQQASARLLESFLPTVDNLERALGAATESDTKLVVGIDMVVREFVAALARHGITPVESVGHAFDPALHDALQQVDSPDHPPGVVVQEFEKGYVRGERLLRPARVVVAGPGSTGSAPPEARRGAGDTDA